MFGRDAERSAEESARACAHGRIIYEEDAAAADKPIFPSTITRREITAVPQDAGSIVEKRERKKERGERERDALSR